MANALEPPRPAEPKRPVPAPASRRRTPSQRVSGKRQGSSVIRLVSGIMTLAMMVFIGVAVAGLWYETTVEEAGPLAAAKAFSIRKDEATETIAQRLESDGIISSARSFMLHYRMRWLAARFGSKPVLIKAGDYEIQPQASLSEVMDVLGEGRTVLARITVLEGLTSARIVEQIKLDRNLDGEVSEVPPEGSLLPDTYKFTKGMQRQAFLDLMAQKSREVLEQAWAERDPGLPFKTPAEALILASIVEKESGRRDERARIAAVFVNRLRKPMRLQSDPTIRYGLSGGQSNWGQPYLKSEIQQKTAYNTYQIDGLPPTPICNPGRAAIQAVLKPLKTNEVFFVADGKGGHVFSTTLKEHEAAVAVWRKVEREIRAREAQRAQAKAAAAGAAAAAADAQSQSLPLPSAGPGVGTAEPDPDSVPPGTAGAVQAAAGPAETQVPAPAPVAAAAPKQAGVVTVPVQSQVIQAPGNDAEPAVALPVRKPKRP